MLRISIGELLKVVRGTLLQGDRNVEIKGVSIDSRTIKKGNLFIAVPGQRFDGHRFIWAALESGAKAVLINRPQKLRTSQPVVLVRDTISALGSIAHYYRRQFEIPFIAITGSAGKTTTKEMVANVLGAKYCILKNERSENNQFGVPLTLLKLKTAHQVAVLEVGTSQKGEIDSLARLIQPQVSLLTNIGASHLEGLKSLSGVFQEKKGLVRHLAPGGCLIYNADDRFLSRLGKVRKKCQRISFGIVKNATVQARDVHDTLKGGLEFKVNKSVFKLASPARHQVYNALAAIAVGKHLGIGERAIQKRLHQPAFCKGRQRIQVIRGVKLIDDTYNANPVSYMSSIETLYKLKTKGKKILIGGDMLELGSSSRKWHEQVGQAIAQSSIDIFLGYGREVEHMCRVCLLKAKKRITVKRYQRLDHLHRYLAQTVHAGDTVWIKGSRGMRLERTVDYIKNLK